MIVLRETRYRVFGSATFAGNPVTLFEVDGLDDGAALQHAASRSSTTDNVFFVAADGTPLKARFFSSTAELWLCGHGLLALSHHMHAAGATGAREVLSPYDSSSGTPYRTWQLYADAQAPGVLMPAQRSTEIPDHTHWMHQALRKSGIPSQCLYACPNGVSIVVLREKDELLRLDADAIAALPVGNNTPGALIAALRLPDGGYGFRYFAPWHGKPEDSGTGSAHSYLAPLLAAARTPVTALQFSPEGVAEMRVLLLDHAVALSGNVELCT